jgi:hypothetical protein
VPIATRHRSADNLWRGWVRLQASRHLNFLARNAYSVTLQDGHLGATEPCGDTRLVTLPTMTAQKLSCVMLLAVSLAGAASSFSQTRPPQDKPDAPTPRQTASRDSLDLSSPDFLQSSSQSPDSPPSPQNPTGPPSNPTGQQDENPKRILGIIPNFQTKDDTPRNQLPLTPKQKYVLALHQTVDISAHLGNAFQASLQQAVNGQPHFGQGWGAYAERFGAAEGDQVTSAFFIFGFLPHILHDDPRYFRKARGPLLSRLRYSATRTVISRTDAGNPTFNIPQVVGQLLQQSISTAYYPEVDRTVGRVFENWGTSLAYNCAYNVLKEFYPDVLHAVFHRRQAHLAANP